MAKKSTKFKKSTEADSEEKYTETSRSLREVANKCPKLGPRKCPYMVEVGEKLKCRYYTEPWKKWYGDKSCYMYRTHKWDEEDEY